MSIDPSLRRGVLLLLVASLGAAAPSGCVGVGRVDVARVLTSGRDGWRHPEQVIEALEIRAGDRVAEFDFLPAQSFQIFAPQDSPDTLGP
ncbi:MAG: hypothetical protein MJE66_20470 [Proteobacteria bacterium]|nr:hypothetical protein [Pseudomonadota bacterium]